MTRTVRDTNLETRSARLRLRVRAEPYWRGLEKGFFAGVPQAGQRRHVARAAAAG